MPHATLIYVGDPMCSWCYGFGPQLAAVVDALAGRIGLELVVGGLRPYTTTAMDDQMRDMLRHHWLEVGKRSGQPFNFDLLLRDDFVYDTEPASRAVVIGRTMDPQRALPLFAALQDAFYRDNRDITRATTLSDIAAEQGFERGLFMERFESEEADRATRADFQAARRMGVMAFPTLVVQRGERLGLLCQGYVPAAQLIGALEAVIAQGS